MKAGQDLDNYDWDDYQREKAVGPKARQLCHGSRRQLMIDAENTVTCPECLLTFTQFETQRNRARVHPVVPGHLADPAGQMKVQLVAVQRRREGPTPRPW